MLRQVGRLSRPAWTAQESRSFRCVGPQEFGASRTAASTLSPVAERERELRGTSAYNRPASGGAPRTGFWLTAEGSMSSIPISKDRLLRLYRQMLLIRRCEEQLAKSHQRGEIHGACHTYVGQEAIAVGVCDQLRTDDAIFSTHRGHGHALAKGVPPAQLIAELYGRATGCSRGRGGSIHLFAPEVAMMGTSGIVGLPSCKPSTPVTASNCRRPTTPPSRFLATEPRTIARFTKG